MDDYDNTDNPRPQERHPFDSTEVVNKLRHTRTMRAIFKNLENGPNKVFEKLPRRYIEALSDLMTFRVVRLTYENRAPETEEQFYRNLGKIEAFEELAQFFSLRALQMKENEGQNE